MNARARKKRQKVKFEGLLSLGRGGKATRRAREERALFLSPFCRRETLEINERVRTLLAHFPAFRQCKSTQKVFLTRLEVQSESSDPRNSEGGRAETDASVQGRRRLAIRLSSVFCSLSLSHLAAGTPPRTRTWRASPEASCTRRQRPGGEAARSRPRRVRPARRRGNWAAGTRSSSSTSRAPRWRGGRPTL
jgi:hypothetical protein